MAPTFVHIPSVKAALNSSIGVAAQNCWVKGSGAYTGEIRCLVLPSSSMYRESSHLKFLPLTPWAANFVSSLGEDFLPSLE